jgi:hypothetical protein
VHRVAARQAIAEPSGGRYGTCASKKLRNAKNGRSVPCLSSQPVNAARTRSAGLRPSNSYQPSGSRRRQPASFRVPQPSSIPSDELPTICVGDCGKSSYRAKPRSSPVSHVVYAGFAVNATVE